MFKGSRNTLNIYGKYAHNSVDARQACADVAKGTFPPWSGTITTAKLCLVGQYLIVGPRTIIPECVFQFCH